MMKGSMYELLSILQLGLASLFMFVGFDTHSFVLESVMHSVNERAPDRIDEYAGYYGLAVSHVCYAFANLFAPVLISYAHPKWSLFLGSIGFTIYNAGFLYLNSFYFYISSFIMGLGFSMFYVGQGCYISEHSSKSHLARNSSIAWGVTCTSFAVGGLVLILVLGNDQVTSGRGHQEYSEAEIRWIFGAFAVCAFLSNIMFAFLPTRKVQNSICASAHEKKNGSFSKRLMSTFKTLGNRNVWWLSFSWIYLGIVTSLLLGVYPTALIFTESLESSITTIVCYSVAISGGELAATVIISVLSKHCRNFGRVSTYVMGFVINFLACLLIVVSTPRFSPLYPNRDEPLLFKPNFFIALLVGFLLGLADGCWNTTRNYMIPLLLPDHCAEGFSLSKMFQSFASCIIFFLSTMIDLYGHFVILVVFNILALMTFIMASKQYDRKRRDRHGYGINVIAPSGDTVKQKMFS